MRIVYLITEKLKDHFTYCSMVHYLTLRSWLSVKTVLKFINKMPKSSKGRTIYTLRGKENWFILLPFRFARS